MRKDYDEQIKVACGIEGKLVGNSGQVTSHNLAFYMTKRWRYIVDTGKGNLALLLGVTVFYHIIYLELYLYLYKGMWRFVGHLVRTIATRGGVLAAYTLTSIPQCRLSTRDDI